MNTSLLSKGPNPTFKAAIEAAKSWAETFNEAIEDKAFLGTVYDFLLDLWRYGNNPSSDKADEIKEGYPNIDAVVQEYMTAVVKDNHALAPEIIKFYDHGYKNIIVGLNGALDSINAEELKFSLTGVESIIDMMKKSVAENAADPVPEEEVPTGKTIAPQKPKKKKVTVKDTAAKVLHTIGQGIKGEVTTESANILQNSPELGEVDPGLLPALMEMTAKALGSSFTKSDAEYFEKEKWERREDKALNLGAMIAQHGIVMSLFSNADISASQKKVLGDYSAKILNRPGSINEVASIAGDKFWDNLMGLLSQRYPSESGEEHVRESAKREPRRMSHKQEQWVFSSFYKQLKEYFLGYLNPPENSAVEDLFRAFPSADSPFERSVHWMEKRYNDVGMKQDKTNGDEIFLKIYANKGADMALMMATPVVAGLAARMKNLLRMNPYKAVDPNQKAEGGPEYNRMSPTEMSETVAKKLMVVVKNAGQKQGTDWKGLMTASSARRVVTAEELPPIPEPPQSVVDSAERVTQSIEDEKSVAQENESRNDFTTRTPSGAAFNALAVGAVIFSELRVAIDEVDADKIDLVRDKPQEGTSEEGPSEAAVPEPSATDDGSEKINLVRDQDEKINLVRE